MTPDHAVDRRGWIARHIDDEVSGVDAEYPGLGHLWCHRIAAGGGIDETDLRRVSLRAVAGAGTVAVGRD